MLINVKKHRYEIIACTLFSILISIVIVFLANDDLRNYLWFLVGLPSIILTMKDMFKKKLKSTRLIFYFILAFYSLIISIMTYGLIIVIGIKTIGY